MSVARKIISIVLALFAALMLVMTLTVPAIAATAPAILTIASAVIAWFIWPRNRTSPTHVASSDSA